MLFIGLFPQINKTLYRNIWVFLFALFSYYSYLCKMKEQPTNDKFKARVPWEWTLSDGTHMKGYWENGRPVNYWIFYSSSLKHKTIRKQYIIR